MSGPIYGTCPSGGFCPAGGPPCNQFGYAQYDCAASFFGGTPSLECIAFTLMQFTCAWGMREQPHVLYFNSLSFLAVPQWFGWFIVCGRWHRICSIVSEQFLMIALLSLMQDSALLSLSSSPSSFTTITSECMCGLGRSWQHHHLSLSRRLLTIAIISFPC